MSVAAFSVATLAVRAVRAIKTTPLMTMEEAVERRPRELGKKLYPLSA